MYISVQNIVKEFKVSERKKGFLSMLRSLIDFEYKIIRAVDDISFEIQKGEMVGFIGPNGAGKSTTIKILCGILQPTSGTVELNKMNPGVHRKKIAKKIGVIFGQKTQLIWDLPVIESYMLLRDIYEINNSDFKTNLKLFDDLLGINEFINRPVRQLSLGQRMKSDICASLLHNPETIYFDEPTIGLDVVAKENIRQFIKEINKKTGTTVLFTTHDMDDIEKTCNRLIIIDKGRIMYDGGIEEIRDTLIPEKLVTVQFNNIPANTKFSFTGIKEIINENNNKKTFRISNDPLTVKNMVNHFFEKYSINDIIIHNPEIESIIRDIYNGKIRIE
jgi:ABC-2 type transport system ATP-binding protein